MMPTLLKGDRLVVSKFPYGWSWVSPSFHVLPPTDGRLFGSLPERGDIVIVTPPGQTSDYIKRVVGLPGDTIEMIDGHLILNGVPVRRLELPPATDRKSVVEGKRGEVRVVLDGSRYMKKK